MLISCSASQGLSQYNFYFVLSEEMRLLWEEKEWIREMNIYLTEILNSNRKLIPRLLLFFLDYF